MARYRSAAVISWYEKLIRVLSIAVIVLLVACIILTVLWRSAAKKAKGTASVGEASSLSVVSADSSQENLAAEVVSSSSKAGSAAASSTPKSSAAAASSKVGSSSKTVPASGQLGQWNLKLVNRQNLLENNTNIQTAKIEARFARDVGMKYDARAVSYLNAMCAAAEKDGVSLLVISSFRLHSRQVTLFQNQLKKVKANNPQLSEQAAIDKAATVVAYPGSSEHELGLAVDFNSVEETFENTKQFAWLQAHAAEYGFVMRYPKSKQGITGVIYEPWHYRYVGKDHAAKMNQLGYCLEEYVTYLKQQTK